MVIETDGVTTKVSREYESEFTNVTSFNDAVAVHVEMPALADVSQGVAAAAVMAHRLTSVD